MLSIDEGLLRQYIPIVEKECKEPVNILYYDEYAKRVLNEKFNKVKPTYPQIIKIPDELQNLMKFKDPKGVKDFPCHQEIVIKEPIVREGIHYWFDTSIKSVDLGLGYVDGDFRIQSFATLSDKDIHMFLAGKTGMGKSVAVNNIILRMCMQYAPWEIKLTMSDAKINEFKGYALGAIIPHISTIAATRDSDFLISVIKTRYDEMLEWNTFYGNTPCKNIEQLRKRYGIAVPRNIIICDEVQVMFEMAAQAKGKVKEQLDSYIDGFARLGRNTGYHLLLCSQQIGSSISKNTLEQITVRAALGLTEETSNLILENPMASTIQVKGKLIYNPIRGKGNEGSNVFYKVPFADDEQLPHFKEVLEDLGKQFKFKYDLVFYDETFNVEEKDYMDYIMSFPQDINRFQLAEPNYLTPNGMPRVVSINFENNKPENILILNTDSNYVNRILKMLYYNIKRPGYEADVDAFWSYSVYRKGSNADKFLDINKNLESIISEDDAAAYNDTLTMVCMRKLMLQIEESIFDEGVDEEPSEDSNLYFDEIKENYGESFDTLLNRKRIHLAKNYIVGKISTQVLLGLTENARSGLAKVDPNMLQFMLDGLGYFYNKWDANDRRLTSNDIPPWYIVLGGLDKLQGIGVMQQNRLLERLKFVLTNTAETNVRFIITAMEKENITDLFASMEFFFFDSNSGSLPGHNKIGCEEYNSNIAENMFGFYSRSTAVYGRKYHKVKKMAFNGEHFKLG